MAQLKPMLEGFGSGDAQGRVGYGQKFDARPAGRDIPEGGGKNRGTPSPSIGRTQDRTTFEFGLAIAYSTGNASHNPANQPNLAH